MDFLSDLPDHLLVEILLRLRTMEAATTTILSRRWRAVWAQLPHLDFDGVNPSAPARALASYQDLAGFDIHSLAASPNELDEQETFAWLSLAAPLLSGPVCLDSSRAVPAEILDKLHMQDEVEGEDEGREVLVLPCLNRATKIQLDLGFVALALPPVGVFDALRLMFLHNFRYLGQLIITDEMLPSLQHLTMERGRKLNLLLNSNALVYIHLSYCTLVQQLYIMAPGLQQLEVISCFYDMPTPVASITAERLQVLSWDGPYDAEFVHLGQMPCLWRLQAPPIFTFHWHLFQMAEICAKFLHRFEAVEHLELRMSLGPQMEGSLLLMEDLRIPDLNILVLSLETNGHAFERSVLRLLTKCSGIRKLNLSFENRDEARNFCLPGCICHTEPTVEAVPMRALTKVDIANYFGEPPEVYLLEQLLLRAPRIRMLRIISEVEDPSLGIIESLCPADCVLELRSEKE